jgi:hypothetical protein
MCACMCLSVRSLFQVGVDGLIVSNTTLARPASLQSPNKTETGGLSGGQGLFRCVCMRTYTVYTVGICVLFFLFSHPSTSMHGALAELQKVSTQLVADMYSLTNGKVGLLALLCVWRAHTRGLV